MLWLALALVVGSFALYVSLPPLLLYWRYPWPVFATLAAAVVVAWSSGARGWLRATATGLSAFLFVFFVAYTVFLSRLDAPRLAVEPGDRFPDFTLLTSTKDSFSPADLYGKTAALYVFYRGDW